MKQISCGKSQSVTYFSKDMVDTYEAKEGELYYYKTFIGKQVIEVEKGDSAWTINSEKDMISVVKGPTTVNSNYVTTVIRGYMTPEKHIKLDTNTNLPYVNGCSTRQLIHVERIGDPTYQLLQIPAGSHEQSHHIHSTSRVVFVLSGYGWSLVGMEGNLQKTRLEPGMVGVFDPMTPHHFETDSDADEPLIVLPLHVYSATGVAEFNHPMFNGTYLMNQGH